MSRWGRWIINSALLGASLAIAGCSQADAQQGRALFNAKCQGCHSRGPSALRTAPEDVGRLLLSGTVRPHRFSLTADEVRDLTAYLQSQPAH